MFTIIQLATQIVGTVSVLKLTQPLAAVPVNTASQIKIDGELMIGGLFPVHSKGTDLHPCGSIMEGRGIHRVEAMLYALDKINGDPALLPGIRLGALILDTCSTPAYALNQSLDFVRDLMGSMDTSHYKCKDGKAPVLLEKSEPVVGVIGGSYSGVSIQVANLLRLFHIVQISPASTNADLSDKTKFEYFARTVPSDNFQAKAMADIAQHYQWNYVSLVYSAGDYGELGADAFKKEARVRGICIATEEKIAKAEQLPTIVTSLIARSSSSSETGAVVVIVFTRNDDLNALLAEVHEQEASMAKNRKIVWLASEAWEMRQETTAGREAVAEGALVLTLESKRVPDFERYFLSLHPKHSLFSRNEWLKEFWEVKFGCRFESDKKTNISFRTCEEMRLDPEAFNPDNKVQFVIDAVYAMAHALHQIWMDYCGRQELQNWITRSTPNPPICSALKHVDGTQLYQTYLLNVSFTDPVGNEFKFDNQGDGPAYYKISNYKRTEGGNYEYVGIGFWHNGDLSINESLLFWNGENYTGVVSSRCSADCKKGQRKELIKDEICCWACIDCEPYMFMANETTCIDCGEGRWPTPNRDNCYDMSLSELKHMEWNSVYSIVPCILAVLGIILTIQVLIVYMKYNDTPVVKASGRELSYILLVAMLFCYMMTFILLAKPTTILCGLKRIGVGFGFSVLYSSMLVKTNRIYRIFSSARCTAARPRFISPLSQVVLACALASVQLLGSLIWLVIQPPGIRHYHPTRRLVVLKCMVEDHWFLVSLGYDAVLIVLCTVFAVKTRKVPENFNEAKFIGFTMYTTCIIWLAFVPIYFGTGSDFQIQTTTLCISISLSATVALFCIFSPKLWIILIEPDKNVQKRGGERMLSSKGSNMEVPSSLPTPYTPLISNQGASLDSPYRRSIANHEAARSSSEDANTTKQRHRNQQKSSYESLESLTSV